eukprot:566969-Ditylum_brightwellii.AAC.1
MTLMQTLIVFSANQLQARKKITNDAKSNKLKNIPIAVIDTVSQPNHTTSVIQQYFVPVFTDVMVWESLVHIGLVRYPTFGEDEFFLTLNCVPFDV